MSVIVINLFLLWQNDVISNKNKTNELINPVYLDDDDVDDDYDYGALVTMIMNEWMNDVTGKRKSFTI